MVESKGWKWEIVKDDAENYWKNPSVESYYLLNRWKSQKFENFLDLGCGLGRHSMLFGRNGFRVHCFDISEDAIRRTREWAESENLEFDFKIGDMLNLPYADESMDCVLCRNVISHSDTNGVRQAIEEIRRVLRPGGECYLTLGSKDSQNFKQKDWIPVDENTKLRTEEGTEYMVPHFFADYALCRDLFAAWEILSITQIEEFIDRSGDENPSFHYHVHIKR